MKLIIIHRPFQTPSEEHEFNWIIINSSEIVISNIIINIIIINIDIKFNFSTNQTIKYNETISIIQNLIKYIK